MLIEDSTCLIKTKQLEMFEIDDLDLDLEEDYLTGPFGKRNIGLHSENAKTSPAPGSSSEPCFKKPKAVNLEDRPIIENTCKSSLSDIFNNSANSKLEKSRHIDEMKDILSSAEWLHEDFSEFSNTPKVDISRKVEIRERKFPGPAGLLPDRPPCNFNESNIELDESSDNIETRQTETQICSQTSRLIFNEPPYQKMLKDLGMDSENSPLYKFTIDWIVKKALVKKLNGQKIPFLAVMIQNLDCSSPDPLVILKDMSGEINGTLHRDVWAEFGSKLHVGAVLVLRQVGVLSTGSSRRHIYLNITQNNIITVYSTSDVEDKVTVSNIRPYSSLEIVNSIQRWQADI